MRIKLNNVDKGRSSAGFTLAEVVVAVGVLAVSFVSLYAGISQGVAMTQVSRENLRATQIMVEKMEGIRLFKWDQITQSNMIPTKFSEHYYPEVGNSSGRGIGYTGTITVSDPASFNFSPPRNYDSDTRVVSVGVNWTSGDVRRTRRMSTLVSKYGLQNYVYDEWKD